MNEPYSTAHSVYLACALAGTGFFLLRIALTAIFGGGDSDHAGVGAGGHDSGVSGTESLDSYRLFSTYSLSAFAMTFGWAGLAFSEQFGLDPAVSLILALVLGSAVMALTAFAFYGMRRLTSSGSRFTLDDLPGKTAKVYQRIPTGGTGVIQVTVDGMLREVTAISADGKEIESHLEVKVERVVDGAVVSVRPISVLRS